MQYRICFLFSFIVLSIISSVSQTNISDDGNLENSSSLNPLNAIVSTKLDQAHFEKTASEYYQKNDKIMALVYFEKALKMSPNSSALKNNIAMIQKELDIQSHPRMVALMNILNVSGIFAPNTWAILSLSTLAALLAFIVFKFPWKQWTSRNTLILSCLCILLFVNIIFSYYRYLQVYNNEGIILTENTFLYEAPDMVSPQIIDLQGGTKVYYDETVGDFYKVKTDENLIGWVPISHSIQI